MKTELNLEQEDREFEAWAISEGLIQESHGIRSINSNYGLARMAWFSAKQVKEEEIMRLHVKLASEKLRADQGWARYEHANKGRLERDLLVERMARVKKEPLSDKQLAECLGSVDDLLFFENPAEALRQFARSIETAIGIGSWGVEG